MDNRRNSEDVADDGVSLEADHDQLPDYEGDPGIDHGDLAIAWRIYDDCVRRTAGFETPASKAFSHKQVHLGQLPQELAERAYKAVYACQEEPYASADFTPGFVTCDFPAQVINSLNSTSGFRQFDLRSSWVIGDVLDEIRDEVADCLGSPWKTINVRAWTTRPESEAKGPYQWHSDGFPREFFKILVYLSPLSPETGMVEFQVDGKVVQHRSEKPGAWVLFNHTDIIHRGVPGKLRERLVVDIIICRAAAFDTRVRYPGQNSHWPSFPWIDALDGCATEDAHRIAEISSKCPELFSRPKETKSGSVLRFLNSMFSVGKRRNAS